MEITHDLVFSKNLKIIQNSSWFSFSLDSILLANFVTIRLRDKMYLDLGCGNAPIPLILSERTKGKITGVEIQEDIYNLALKSIIINKKEQRIDLIHDNMLNLIDRFNSDTFDVITMNPPYFKNSSKSIVNIDQHKTIARHEVSMTLEKSLDVVRKLLKNNGLFAMVHRTERFVEIIDLLKKYSLEPKRIQFIHPKIGENSNLFLIETSKNAKVGVKLLSPLFIHNEKGNYRKEVLDIFEMRETYEPEEL